MAYFPSRPGITAIERYQRYVNKGVDNKLLKKITGIKSPAILGSDDFIKAISSKINQADTQEIPDHKPIAKIIQPSLAKIQNKTAHYFQVPNEEINNSKQYIGNFPRKVAIYMSCKYTSQSHQAIANYFGNTNRYGVTRVYHELNSELAKNSELANIFIEIESAFFLEGFEHKD